MGSPVGVVVEMKGSVAAVQVARDFAQSPAAGQSRLPVGGPGSVEVVHASELPARQPSLPAGAGCRLAARAV